MRVAGSLPERCNLGKGRFKGGKEPVCLKRASEEAAEMQTHVKARYKLTDRELYWHIWGIQKGKERKDNVVHSYGRETCLTG